MKLWQKNIDVHKAVESFTVGQDREFDRQLAPFDVLGSLAHVTMLQSVQLLEEKETAQLIEELKKIHRILGRKDPSSPHEVLLVVDATTGANALQQAREFQKATKITGLIVTKLDGSGKGGILVPIQQELDIPTRFIGLGEKAEDFQEFDAHKFVEELL